MRQRINSSDPVVARWIVDCGLAGTPVAIKLTGESEDDVALQVRRMERAFGSLVQFSAPRRVSNGVEWIAHGTLLA
jgi:hypothetical protein